MVATTKKTIGGSKNGSTREVPVTKAPKTYPAEPESVKAPSTRELNSRGVAKLRKSIEPGSVLILLAGRFRGRRVVFLKQLASGLLLVSGPYAVNGIPLRRVNQAYVIATSTKVDVSKVDCSKFKDEYFGKATKKASKKKFEEFFEEAATKNEPTAARLADQKAVDAAMMPAVNAVPLMAKYLKARVSLSRGQAPHKMMF